MDEYKWKSMNKICPWNYNGNPPYIRCPIYSNTKLSMKNKPPRESICINKDCVFYDFIGED